MSGMYSTPGLNGSLVQELITITPAAKAVVKHDEIVFECLVHPSVNFRFYHQLLLRDFFYTCLFQDRLDLLGIKAMVLFHVNEHEKLVVRCSDVRIPIFLARIDAVTSTCM
jgi:hypothetical protein